VSTAVNLAPLGSYGGSTQTMVPLPGSTAICAGTLANATTAGITTDQRGFPFDSNCPAGSVDSGAVQTKYSMLFSNVPYTTVSGQVLSPAPAVTLYESGVISTTPTTAVTLSDASSALTGTTTENLSSGTATFPNVSFSAIGLDTQLIATMALNSSVNLVHLAGNTTTVSPVPATLTSPSPGSTLLGPEATFSWSPATGATAYSLWIGSTGVGSSNVYVFHSQTATSIEAGVLPTNGETLYVRLFTSYNGAINYTDYTYTAATQAALTFPSPGTTLGSGNAFSWSPATGAIGYSLWIGSTGVGSGNLYVSHATTALTVSVTGLPVNGETIYARLYTIYSSSFEVFSDYTYTAATGATAMLTSPSPGGSLPGARVTFTWSPGTGVTDYRLWLGSTGPGSNNLYQSPETPGFSVTATNLPVNGETIYARLYTSYNGVIHYTDYTYTAAP
jgi:serine protease